MSQASFSLPHAFEIESYSCELALSKSTRKFLLTVRDKLVEKMRSKDKEYLLITQTQQLGYVFDYNDVLKNENFDKAVDEIFNQNSRDNIYYPKIDEIYDVEDVLNIQIYFQSLGYELTHTVYYGYETSACPATWKLWTTIREMNEPTKALHTRYEGYLINWERWFVDGTAKISTDFQNFID